MNSAWTKEMLKKKKEREINARSCHEEEEGKRKKIQEWSREKLKKDCVREKELTFKRRDPLPPKTKRRWMKETEEEK